MTIPERAVLREETRLLGREVAALDAEQQLFVLLALAGSDPGAVRHALDTERATRRAGAEAR